MSRVHTVNGHIFHLKHKSRRKHVSDGCISNAGTSNVTVWIYKQVKSFMCHQYICNTAQLVTYLQVLNVSDEKEA